MEEYVIDIIINTLNSKKYEDASMEEQKEIIRKYIVEFKEECIGVGKNMAIKEMVKTIDELKEGN